MPGMKARSEADAAVGARIKERRILLGLSQEALGSALGLTFQQVQKYEKGMNRVAVTTAMKICEILQCNMAYLVGEDPARQSVGEHPRLVLEIVRALGVLPERFQRHILGLVHAINGAIDDPLVERRAEDRVAVGAEEPIHAAPV